MGDGPARFSRLAPLVQAGAGALADLLRRMQLTLGAGSQATDGVARPDRLDNVGEGGLGLGVGWMLLGPALELT